VLCMTPLILIGGDLNFTFSLREFWGKNPFQYSQSSFIFSFLLKHHLLNIELLKLDPTWRNFRTNGESISKRMERILVSEQLMNCGLMMKTCVSASGISYHFPIFFKLEEGCESPMAPLKFNPTWLEESDLCAIVEVNWVHIYFTISHPLMHQLVENLESFKEATKRWLKIYERRTQSQLLETEENIA
jgi:hypothetical protein